MKIKSILPTIKYKLNLFKREARFFYQSKTRGFDDSDMWSLDYSLAKLNLPQLKHFRKMHGSHPNNLTQKQCGDILDEMIWSFTCYCGEQWSYGKDYAANSKRADEWFKLFAEYFGSLWT